MIWENLPKAGLLMCPLLLLGCGKLYFERVEIDVQARSDDRAVDSTDLFDIAPDRVVEITSGNGHTCGRVSNGDLLCWGANWSGQIGNGIDGGPDVYEPYRVPDIPPVLSVNAGDEMTCALFEGGTAKCWGWDQDGSLGSGANIANSGTPVDVVGLSGIRQIVPARTTTCAVLDSGEVWCFGDDAFGQLGNSGATGDSATPVQVTGITDAVAAAGAEGHFCALHSSGEVSCWGWNASGQLGSDPGTDSTFPVSVPGIDDAVSIGVGHSHSCAIRASGELWCWGANDSGQLGIGTTGFQIPPGPVMGLSDVVQVVGGYVHTCALTSAREVYCFGWDGYGNIGNNEIDDDTVLLPERVINVEDVVDITAEGLADFNCALTFNGDVYCWGNGFDGQLGNGESLSVCYSPIQAQGLP